MDRRIAKESATDQFGTAPALDAQRRAISTVPSAWVRVGSAISGPVVREQTIDDGRAADVDDHPAAAVLRIRVCRAACDRESVQDRRCIGTVAGHYVEAAGAG